MIAGFSFLDNIDVNNSFVGSKPKSYELFSPTTDDEKNLIWLTKRILNDEVSLDLGDEINWNSDMRMAEMWVDKKRRVVFKRDKGVVKIVFKY